MQARLGSMSGNTQADLKKVYDHVFRLEEELRYLLTNLDVTNFNDLGLARYENGRMQVYTQALEIRASKLKVEFEEADGRLKTEFDAGIDGLKSTVEEQEKSISSLNQTASQIQSTVQEQGNTINGHTESISSLTQTASQIQTTVENQGSTISNMKSSITQNADNISAIVTSVGSGGKVTAASIVAAINDAGSTVKISADHITLTGFVTVEDLKGEGTTEINGSNIKSGTIEGVTIKSSGGGFDDVEISGAHVYVGSGALFSENGRTYLTDYGGVTISARNEVCIEVGTSGKYWQFTTSGIYFRDINGNMLNQVQLMN